MPVRPGDEPRPSAQDLARINALQPLIDEQLLNHEATPSDDRIFISLAGPEPYRLGKPLTKAQLLELQRRYCHWNVGEFKDTREPYSIEFRPRKEAKVQSYTLSENAAKTLQALAEEGGIDATTLLEKLIVVEDESRHVQFKPGIGHVRHKCPRKKCKESGTASLGYGN